MSIAGAIIELNKEIDRLNKEVERLIKMRDSLSHGYVGVIPPVVSQPATEEKTVQGKRKYTRSAKLARKTAAKKTAPVEKPSVAKKASTVSTVAPLNKRVMSAATRKKMSDSAKARAAAKAEAAK
ncbi:hypothetical protein [Granulicella sp. dw_53]|uniref:hypothetical protein n=1 Tax=Granulicella sp. dw_53 TaxID=2719792 RepID=UPI001BD51DF1|nr:hypothetical protein [Granulicella sp. dw_53]